MRVMEEESHSERSHSSSSTDQMRKRRRYYYAHPEDFSDISSCSYPEEDRISDLPDCILIHILSLLPTTDVIATATLSQRWRFLWTMVPNLAFSYGDYRYCTIGTSLFVSVVDRALLLHECSQIKKFSVEFNYLPEFRSAVDVWLRAATRKNVEELDLGFKFWHGIYMYGLPQHLYSNSSLVKLTLSHCSMKPSGVISWPSLKILCIGHDAELNDNLIESILSGSPVLESLELYDCGSISRLNINFANLKKLVVNGCEDCNTGERSLLQISAPKVESLSISGFMSRKECWVANVPSLVHASLDFELRIDEDDFRSSDRRKGKQVMNLLKTLNHVEELTIGAWCIQVLSLLEVKIFSPMSTFRCLTLNTKLNVWEHPAIGNLLRSSINLETLVINMSRPDSREFSLEANPTDLDEMKYWNAQEEVLVNSLQHLKTVKIVDGHLHHQEIKLLLALLQFLLKNARALEKVVISAEEDATSGSLHSLKVAQRLLSFPRASPIAEGNSEDHNKLYPKVVMKLLKSVNHVKALTVGTWCIQVLSIFEGKDLSSLLSNIKCLILNTHLNKWDLPGIANLLRSSTHLESFIINMISPCSQQISVEVGFSFTNLHNFDEEKYSSLR